MTVPVVGSLVSLATIAFLVPHRLGIQPSRILWGWSDSPKRRFKLPHDGVGLSGISLCDLEESAICDSCGQNCAEDIFFYEWRPAVGADEVYALHDECLEGYSTLHGADLQTLKALQALEIEFGSFLADSYPRLSHSLQVRTANLHEMCAAIPPCTEALSRKLRRRESRGNNTNWLHWWQSLLFHFEVGGLPHLHWMLSRFGLWTQGQ